MMVARVLSVVPVVWLAGCAAPSSPTEGVTGGDGKADGDSASSVGVIARATGGSKIHCQQELHVLNAGTACTTPVRG